jgi:hypothetical protein
VIQFYARTLRLTLESFKFLALMIALLPGHGLAVAQENRALSTPNTYFKLEKPRRILSKHQRWEVDQFPHTLSVLEMNRDEYRYWGWYGLNDGGGIGLARSKDLVHWAKYVKNPCSPTRAGPL